MGLLQIHYLEVTKINSFNIPNLITASRILLSISLLFVEPQSILFFVIYAICGTTDILDGYIARRKKIATNLGSTLDSLADFIFICIMLIIYLPILKIPTWCMVCVAVISIIRLISVLIGFIKYKTFAFLHTYANKVTGILLFCFPLLYLIFGIAITCFLLSIIAVISAIEELTINITSKKLSRDIKSLFSLEK